MNNKKDKPELSRLEQFKAHLKTTQDLYKKNVIKNADLFLRIKSFKDADLSFTEDGRLLVSFEPERWTFGLDGGEGQEVNYNITIPIKTL